jgi:hypothetical protein
LAAVELAAETFDSLKDKTILIVGAGETARLAAECLIKKRVGKIVITNRTRGRADELLEDLRKSNRFEGETLDFSDFKNYLNRADIVISSTSAPEPILNKANFATQTNKILLIDIAVPRDIAPEVAEMENVVLKNIDDLHAIIDKNYRRRMADLPLVKKTIMREMSEFLVWYYSLPLLPSALCGGAKPDEATLKEIVGVKEFLLKNVSHVHKLAMRNGAENFAGHVEVVNELAAMKRQAFRAERGLKLKHKYIIGSRGSQLALWQTEHVKSELERRFATQAAFAVRVIKTTGDANLDTALSKIGDKGLFTTEIETALARGAIDLAVHSLKDLPTTQPASLKIGAVSERETPNDVFISEHYSSLEDLPEKAKIATGSLRRRSQLLNFRPDLEVVEIRGNVPTRIGKFLASDLDGIILAYAGVHRLKSRRAHQTNRSDRCFAARRRARRNGD